MSLYHVSVGWWTDSYRGDRTSGESLSALSSIRREDEQQ